MRATLLLAATIALLASCNSKRNILNENKFFDTLWVNGKVYKLEIITEEEYSSLNYQFPTGKDTISMDTSRVKISASGISILSENGASIHFLNDTSYNDSRVHYNYIKTFGKLHCVHILAVHYEWTVEHLVNLKTGQEIEMWGPPRFSPTGKYFVSASADLIAQFNPNGFQLFSNSDNGINKIFGKNIDGWGPEEIKWKSDSVIYVKRAKPDEKLKFHYDFVKVKP